MSEQSLIGGTDDVHHGLLWIDPFGNKAREAASGGFRRLSLALAHGWKEQVGSLPAIWSLGNLRACFQLGVSSEPRLGMGSQQGLLGMVCDLATLTGRSSTPEPGHLKGLGKPRKAQLRAYDSPAYVSLRSPSLPSPLHGNAMCEHQLECFSPGHSVQFPKETQTL